MAINVGLYPKSGEILTSSASTPKFETIKISGTDMFDVDQLFKEITLKIGDQKGDCLGICLDEEYGNKIRKKFLECGLQYFKKVQIIDKDQAEFLIARSQIVPRLSWFQDKIWINDGCREHQWEKDFNTFEKTFHRDSSFEYANYYLYDKNMESRLNKRSLCERFPHCQFFDYEDSKNWAKAALIKADILKKNSWFNSFDARNVLVHKYDLMMGETYIGFNTGSYNYSLPKRFVLHFGEVSLKDMDVGELEALEKHRIDSESYHKKSADNLKITQHLDEEREESEIIRFPYAKYFTMEFHVDTNGIYTVKFLNERDSAIPGRCSLM